MYKIHNNILPSYFLNLFTTNLSSHGHFTRQASKLHTAPHHINIKALHIAIFYCYVCPHAAIMLFICSDLIKVVDWNKNFVNMGLC